MLDSRLIDALIEVESGGNPKAVSHCGAKGLCQLMDDTGLEWHKNLSIEEPYDPFNPDQNRLIGTQYFLWLLDRFCEKVDFALAAYNCGIGRMFTALRLAQSLNYETVENYLPTETQKYVQKVLAVFNRKLKEAINR